MRIEDCCTDCGADLEPGEGEVINFQRLVPQGLEMEYWARWCDDCREQRRDEPGIEYG